MKRLYTKTGGTWWTLNLEVLGSIPTWGTILCPCARNSLKYWFTPRKCWLCLDTTEKLLTRMLNFKQTKTGSSMLKVSPATYMLASFGHSHSVEGIGVVWVEVALLLRALKLNPRFIQPFG